MSKAGALYAKHCGETDLFHLMNEGLPLSRAIADEWSEHLCKQIEEVAALSPADRTFYNFLVTAELARHGMRHLQEDGTDLRGVQLPLPGTIASDTSRFGETQ